MRADEYLFLRIGVRYHQTLPSTIKSRINGEAAEKELAAMFETLVPLAGLPLFEPFQHVRDHLLKATTAWNMKVGPNATSISILQKALDDQAAVHERISIRFWTGCADSISEIEDWRKTLSCMLSTSSFGVPWRCESGSSLLRGPQSNYSSVIGWMISFGTCSTVQREFQRMTTKPAAVTGRLCPKNRQMHSICA
jgi:hypothetical protein